MTNHNVSESVLPQQDGHIYTRSSLDTARTSIMLHNCCNTALLAFHLSSHNRFQVVQQLTQMFLEDEDYHINNSVSLLSQLMAWLKQRPELKVLLEHITPLVNKPPLVFKGVGRSDLNHIAINIEHPMRNNFISMLQRIHHSEGYACDIACDPAFLGLYSPSLFDEHAFDPFSFFSYSYVLPLFHGFKPGYTDCHSPWCIDRTNTFLHYTLCNIRWLSLEDNTANRFHFTNNDRQLLQREHDRARKRAERFRFLKTRLNKSFK